MGRSNKIVPAGPSVNDLVKRAGNGDKQAWDALVERYAPLIWSISQGQRLSSADADEVGQRVWLQLVNQLDMIRDSASLPAWLATTTQRECVGLHQATCRSRALDHEQDAEHIAEQQAGMLEDELAAERHAALREAFTHLTPCCQHLIAVLIEDPPVPDAQISARLGIPVASIGPSRRRCLEKLRRQPAIAALIDAEAASAAGELSDR